MSFDKNYTTDTNIAGGDVGVSAGLGKCCNYLHAVQASATGNQHRLDTAF